MKGDTTMSKECPAYKKGRWYTAFIESTGADYKITTIDKGIKDAEMSGTHMQMPLDFIAVDYKFILDKDPIGAAAGTKLEIYKYASGRHGVTLPAASDFTSLCVHVFGYYDKR